MAMTFAYDNGVDAALNRSRMRKVIVSWTSDGSGNASGTTAKVAGLLVKGVTKPTDSPTDNYDIAITDEDGVDVLAACQSTLANRDTTNAEQAYFLVLDAAAGTALAQSVHPAVCGQLAIAVTNAGSGKSGTLTLFLRD